MTDQPRVLIVAHSHPKFRFGGGEIAAHRHFQHLRELGYDAFFLGALFGSDQLDRYFGPGEHLKRVGARDFVIRTPPMDPYQLDHANIVDEDRMLDALCHIDAGIYHFHHIWNIGTRTIRRLMQAKPSARYALTLHEYLPICAHHGQMLKAGTNELCYDAEPLSCVNCLPRFRPESFFLRRHRFLNLLNRFHALISPSHFLRDRFERWGVAPGRIAVIENGLPEFDLPSIEEDLTQSIENKIKRFAFFGQGTPTKGLNVLVEAALELERRGVRGVYIDVWGVTGEEFATSYPYLNVPSSIVRFMGRYRPQDVILKMNSYGWIVIPSIWWENSPVVIQEAKSARVPVIVSNIGGMKEKAAGWGKLFEVGNPHSLADVMEDSARELERYRSLRNGIGAAPAMRTFHDEWARLLEVPEHAQMSAEL